jgi:hypothetical protein
MLIRWEEAFRDQPLAKFDAKRVVDVKDGYRHTADRGKADEVGSLPAKMPVPLVTPRIEEWSELARLRVEASNVGTLVAVVVEARQGQITCDRRASVFDGDDVIDLKGSVVVVLEYLAVFAAATSPPPDELYEGGIHEHLKRSCVSEV